MDRDEATALIDRMRQGDAVAGEALVGRLFPLISRIVRAHLPRGTPAEDLMQDVYLKMFSSLDQYRGDRPFEHWVSRLAVNTCIDQLRARRRRPEWRLADLRDEEVRALEAILSDREMTDATDALAARDLVDRLLETLDPRDRLLITWLDLEDLSVAQVRQRTGWGASMIKMRAWRARRKLGQQARAWLDSKPA